jgi:hypothetical protein
MTTIENFRYAIDDISESIRINGVESGMTEFCVNFLAANIDAMVELWDQDDDEMNAAEEEQDDEDEDDEEEEAADAQ